MDYYEVYGGRELKAMNLFINKNSWLKEIVEKVEKDNTPLHDLILVMKSGRHLTVEVKEDELYWFNRTGNIGLDYISSFTFNSLRDKYQFRNLWVDPQNYNTFIKSITVRKYGKLVTCDADLQFYFVLDDRKENFIFARIYNNNKLKDQNFLDYLNKNYSLRINDKDRYNLSDSWESAAYFVNPLKDTRLQECEMNNTNSFMQI